MGAPENKLPKLTTAEARNIAINLNENCVMFGFMLGSLAFGAMSIALIDTPWMRLIAFVVGGVLGVWYGVPLSAYYYLRKINRDYFPGMAEAVVEWFRSAQPGDSLDMNVLAQKVKQAQKYPERLL